MLEEDLWSGCKELDLGLLPPDLSSPLVVLLFLLLMLVDEDLCLMFLPPEYAKKHPLCSPSVLPFAFCEPAGAVSVAFISHTDGVKVHAFDGEEEVGIEGDFDLWMGIQVTYFLRQIASRRINDLVHDGHKQRQLFRPERLLDSIANHPQKRIGTKK